MKHTETTLTQTLVEHILKDRATGGASSQPSQIRRGTVVGFRSNGAIVVEDSDPEGARFMCQVLLNGNSAPAFEISTPVLFWAPNSESREGVVLGRIGIYDPKPEAERATDDHVTIEAKETLRLKCGDSSIDLRKDGKLMIRGQDVLTRAKRTNRIKGGSVGIN